MELRMGAIVTEEPLVIAFEAALDRLRGQTCWGYACHQPGELELVFGEKVERSRALESSLVSEEYREHDSELRIALRCAWRLSSRRAVLLTSREGEADPEMVMRGFAAILQSPIESITLRPPCLDLEIAFENGLTLAAFCDQTGESCGANYTMYINQFHYEVGRDGAVALVDRTG